ncbi:hypothetical protein BX666DRAFT_1227813 [Dichotomocladium elegans]|nr:hypothetical protein BX666DRAFT_1227813 [Dichotomocladium elegans]
MHIAHNPPLCFIVPDLVSCAPRFTRESAPSTLTSLSSLGDSEPSFAAHPTSKCSADPDEKIEDYEYALMGKEHHSNRQLIYDRGKTPADQVESYYYQTQARGADTTCQICCADTQPADLDRAEEPWPSCYYVPEYYADNYYDQYSYDPYSGSANVHYEDDHVIDQYGMLEQQVPVEVEYSTVDQRISEADSSMASPSPWESQISVSEEDEDDLLDPMIRPQPTGPSFHRFWCQRPLH